MNKGCIYWDESSRGTDTTHKRGRWVGEKKVDGRRVRMRSTILAKVMEWLNQDQSQEGKDGRYKRPKTHRERVDISRLTPIVGMPYYADVEGYYVVNKFGYKINPYPVGSKGGAMQFGLTINRKVVRVSANRLMYAAIHGIDVFRIPDTMVVVRTDDGGYRLITRRELGYEKGSEGYDLHKDRVDRKLETKIKESQILQHYYHTGERSDIIGYAIGITNSLAAYMRYYYGLSQSHSMDVAAEAVEWFCRRIENRDIAVTTIYSTIKGRARLIAKQQQQQRDICRYRKYTSNTKY